jgi:serine/threonine protein kinase
MIGPGSKYRILNKISSGTFGQVYKGQNERTREMVAIKVEKKSGDYAILKSEAKVYQYLGKLDGFPQLKWFGTDVKYNYLVIDLFQCSLFTLKKNNQNIELNNILLFGQQMIERLEILHSKFLLHRDIKPDNFLLDENNKVFLIDFGFCKRYEYNGKHIEEKMIKNIIGTVNYISLNVHNHLEPSRRDDVESVIYIIDFLLLEQEPNKIVLESNQIDVELVKKKQNLDSYEPFIREMLIYIRQIGFKEKPDYKYLIDCLQRIAN